MARGDVLVIGSGAREHALIWKLRQSPFVKTIYAAPGNAGIAEIAINIPINPTNLIGLLTFSRETDVDLTIVGPELPLKLGIADLFHRYGLDIFGPTAAAAKIETSKVFMKYLLSSLEIPTAPFIVFSSYLRALKHVHSRDFPFVIKVDGLAGGKGVYVCQDVKSAEIALKKMMIDKIYGDAGNSVIIENCLAGEEISIHAICSANKTNILTTARDHKTLREGNKGENTGGMGVFAPVSSFSIKDMFHVEHSIVKPILAAMKRLDASFIGCLYPGLMITESGPQVLEINCRFGDPETSALVHTIEGDLFLALQNNDSKHETAINLACNDKYAVCVVLCSKEYPTSINNPMPIYGMEKVKRLENVYMFHGATQLINGVLHTNGGRILNIVGVSDTSLDNARRIAYEACDLVEFHGKQYRRDIGILNL